MHTHMNRPNSSLDWILSHWAQYRRVTDGRTELP